MGAKITVPEEAVIAAVKDESKADEKKASEPLPSARREGGDEPGVFKAKMLSLGPDASVEAKIRQLKYRHKMSNFVLNESEGAASPKRLDSIVKPRKATVDAKAEMDRLVSILTPLSLFAELSEEQGLLIYASLFRVETHADEMVYKIGDEATVFYIVDEGEYEVHDGVTAWPLKQQYFGESALMFTGHRSQSVKCVKDGCLWAIGRLTYQRLCVKGQQQAAKKNDDFLSNVPVLAPLGKSMREKVAAALVTVHYSDGDFIIRQGEIGDSFYIIESGVVSVKEHAGRVSIGEGTDDSVEVVRRKAGEYFGELALMKDEPRNADIVALGNVKCLKLSRKDFMEMMGGPLSELLEHNSAHRVLKSMDLFKPLSDDKVGEIVECLQLAKYGDGEFIVKQGNIDKNFFVIKQGHVKCTRIEEGESKVTEIGDLFAGDFFGEGALLTSKPRRANVIAVGEVQCLVLEREDFEATLGTLKESMDRTFAARKTTDMAVVIMDLEKIRTIGSGSYGTVDLVRHKITGATYALKRIRKKMVVSANHQAFVKNERDILKSVNHPFLVNLIATHKDATSVYMLTEVCLGGELYSLMKETVDSREYSETDEVPGCFPVESYRFYTSVIVCALGYLHGLGIVHRDVKPENLLLGGNGYLKLADFGFAKDLKGGRSYSLCGTPEYTAPEVYKRAGHNTSVDWWALGVLLYEMSSGFSPFHVDSENNWDCYLEISRYSKAYPNVQFPSIFPKDLCKLLVELLAPNPFHRLGNDGVKKVKQHPFFKSVDWTALEASKVAAPYVPPIASIMDTSHFEKIELDPHKEDVALDVTDIDGDWVDGF